MIHLTFIQAILKSLSIWAQIATFLVKLLLNFGP